MRTFGFTVILGKSYNCNNISADSIITYDDIRCFKHMIDKFEKDKVFSNDNNYIVIVDGVILNKNVLITRMGGNTWLDTIIKLYIEKGEWFFDEFRGSFCGLLYDKSSNKTIIFSDHIGTKYIYYSQLENVIIFSTIIDFIYGFLKLNNVKYNLSVESAYLLLTYGFMLEGRTLCDKVFKLKPGYYLLVQDGKISEKRYCLLNNEPDYSMSENEAIELCDSEFRRAIISQFEKDKEYGYKHLVALSGGLDSRMTSWVAHELGYAEQLNYTFSQSDYLDESVPKQIARDLKHEWIFKFLDNGLWLKDIENITKITGGNVLYYGLAHNGSFLENLNLEKYGIIHSGQLGDVIFGTWYESPNPQAQFHLGNGAYSCTYLDKISNISIEKFDNQEISKFYHRGFCGTNNGQLIDMIYSETCSPFMDWDLMNKVLHIPANYRYNHKLYKKWIITKYPKAADYIWETIKASIKEPMINIANRRIPIRILPWKIFDLLKNKIGKQPTNKHMNPIGYYFASNKDLEVFINNILCQYGLINDIELANVIRKIVISGTPIEKIQASSLMCAIKMYFS
ncbi:hypothetical protein [Parabacteroides distasonis]|uniref:hypothetical protein n=1 Tax=Parabacteroides distasonis TaxID=823 RepID=UPI003F25CAB3